MPHPLGGISEAEVLLKVDTASTPVARALLAAPDESEPYRHDARGPAARTLELDDD